MEHADRPTAPDVSSRLFDVLQDAGVRATMFVQGRWAEAYPELAARLHGDGHLIGSHSFYHARMPLLSASGLRTDLRDAERAIKRFCGVDPKPWFRLPFGAGTGDDVLRARVEALGYREVGWHVDSLDWNRQRPRAMIQQVVSQAVAQGDETVILFHGWPRSTLAGMPAIIAQLRSAGAEFVSVDQLDRVPQGIGLGQ